MTDSARADAIEVGGIRIGPDYPCFVIAELGLNHNGDIDMARQLIDVAVEAGASAVKFQRRTISQLAIGSVLDAADDRFPEFGRTYRQIREHLEFGEDEYRGLQRYCRERGILFLCTPFDIEAVNFLERLEVPAYKVASHSVTNLSLLEHLAAIGKPVIMSTGMCTWDELDEAVDIFRGRDTSLALMHCVSAYPQPVEESNLALIAKLRERYGVPVGYSGHELGSLPTLASVAMGAVIVERHVTLDTALVGFDHALSLEPQKLRAMVQEIRTIERAIGSGEKGVSDSENLTRRKYHVSLVTRTAINPGETVTASMLTLKNPGTGLPARSLRDVVGRRARALIPADTILQLDMLEPENGRATSEERAMDERSAKRRGPTT